MLWACTFWYALAYGMGDKHEVFVRQCEQLHTAIEQKRLGAHISCRNCWALVGVEGVSLQHGSEATKCQKWKDLQCVCCNVD